MKLWCSDDTLYGALSDALTLFRRRSFGRLIATCKIFIGYLQIMSVIRSVPGLHFNSAFNTILSIAMVSQPVHRRGHALHRKGGSSASYLPSWVSERGRNGESLGQSAAKSMGLLPLM